MSNPQITKTVLFSVPTEWMGDTMDPDEAGAVKPRCVALTTGDTCTHWLPY